MNHLDVFSGLGGFALAARWLNIETVGFCEIDPWCRRVLAKNFPGVPQHDDIRTLTGESLRGFGPVDLITGGFPCQPYSVAGNRRGNADDRALWPQMARVIDECHPTYVLGENVPGLISVALDAVSADMETLGYSVWTVAVPAVAVDAPHRRDRLWIMAYANDRPVRPHDKIRAGWDTVGNGCEPLADSNGEGKLQPSERRDTKRDRTCNGSQALTNANDSGREKQRGSVTGGSKHPATQFGGWWPVEPGMGRTSHGISHRADRLKGLGNAIVPQVAYEILRVMIGETA